MRGRFRVKQPWPNDVYATTDHGRHVIMAIAWTVSALSKDDEDEEKEPIRVYYFVFFQSITM